ncbi:hypothetical protein [Leucobacter luti]|uniref:hypothetical protein n=1 Tax=Leucobacter luti TaxID=340320 RepID=UPI003D07A0DB
MRKNTPRGARESALASGWTVESTAEAEAADLEAPQAPVGGLGPVPDPDPGLDPDPETAADDAPADERTQLSNMALVMLGVLGGLYLLYSWVWLSWAQYYASVNQEVAATSGSLGSVLQQTVFWAAPLAPVLWFLAVLVLHRRAGTGKMALWLVIGAVVLFPLPVLSGGGAA